MCLPWATIENRFGETRYGGCKGDKATVNETDMEKQKAMKTKKSVKSAKTPLFARKLPLGSQILSTGVTGGQQESSAKLMEQTHK